MDTVDSCCVLFTKPAHPGRVKTRLIGALTAGEAAALQQAFLDDLVRRLRSRDFDLQIAWAIDDGHALPDVGVAAFRQVGDDLGERLLNALQAVGRSYRRVAAIGSDHPEVPAERIDEAFACLDDSDIAIGPASDGGYYLVAAHTKSLDPALFREIEWSTSRVLGETLERCRELDLRVALLDEGADVDSPADLDRLTRFLADQRHDCPTTESLLRNWGMLP